MFDLAEFLDKTGPIASFIVMLVMGVVTVLGNAWPKKIKGGVQGAVAVGVGLVLGGGMFWASTDPKTPPEWFAVFLFGLLCGVTAALKYNADKASSKRGTEKAVEALSDPLAEREPYLL